MREIFETIDNVEYEQCSRLTMGEEMIPEIPMINPMNMQAISENSDGNVMPGVMEEGNEYLINRIGLAQAYVPYQNTFNTMSEDKSLACGTVFPELVQPYKKGSRLKNSKTKEVK